MYLHIFIHINVCISTYVKVRSTITKRWKEFRIKKEQTSYFCYQTMIFSEMISEWEKVTLICIHIHIHIHILFIHIYIINVYVHMKMYLHEFMCTYVHICIIIYCICLNAYHICMHTCIQRNIQ
jgi:hypothetical protein